MFRIGIISWLPDNIYDRQLRIERLNRLLQQLDEFFPNEPITIVAQNWQDFSINKDNIDVKFYQERLGILKARKLLRTALLTTSEDYFIFFDDDAIIEMDKGEMFLFVNLLREHPQGFAFIRGNGSSPFTPYADSQINFAVMSRFILAAEDIPNVDPEKSQGFEDRIWSTLLHYKYAQYEFVLPPSFKCTHFKNPNEPAPSTWAKFKKHNWRQMRENTRNIEAAIVRTYSK